MSRTREGALLSLTTDELWKLEKQLDAAEQHIRLAISLVRKQIAKKDQDIKATRLNQRVLE